MKSVIYLWRHLIRMLIRVPLQWLIWSEWNLMKKRNVTGKLLWPIVLSFPPLIYFEISYPLVLRSLKIQSDTVIQRKMYNVEIKNDFKKFSEPRLKATNLLPSKIQCYVCSKSRCLTDCIEFEKKTLETTFWNCKNKQALHQLFLPKT